MWGSPTGSGRGIANRYVWDTSIKYSGQHYDASHVENALDTGLPVLLRDGLPPLA